VDFATKGVKIEATLTYDGTLIDTEEPGDLKTFPKAAAKALKKATKGMTVKEVEIARAFAKSAKDANGVTTATKLPEPTIAYEMDVEKNGQKGEFAVDADGKILESPKWGKAGEAKEEKDGDDGRNNKNWSARHRPLEIIFPGGCFIYLDSLAATTLLPAMTSCNCVSRLNGYR
jgi:hypothetical protein